MSSVTGPWKCDTCGRPIQKVDDGWVEWYSAENQDLEATSREEKGLRLVHNHSSSPRKRDPRCQYDNQEFMVQDASLDEFVGPDGLMDLLEMLAEKSLPQEEVIEMIKRLHIPFYEETREHTDSAIRDGAFDPNTRAGFYRQKDLIAVSQWMKQQND